MFRQPRQKDPAHLDFIRSLSCVVCGNNIETQACHIRFSCAAVGKVNPGVGQKPSDRWTAPMCQKDHAEQHAMNEEEFWKSKGIDPITLAMQLYAVSGDHEEGERIVRKARQPFNILAAG